MSVVFDANIWISGIVFGGKPAELIELARVGSLEVFISGQILDETLRILKDKFHQTDLEAIRGLIEGCTKRVEPTVMLDVVEDDPDDNKVIECAVAVAADAIVTGDKDLLRIGEYQGIKMVRPSKFLERRT